MGLTAYTYACIYRYVYGFIHTYVYMKTIALISQKGGAGKTTLATALAIEAERNGVSAAILDLDPQASAAKWSDKRSNEKPEVVSIQAERLAHSLDAAANEGLALTFVDTAAKSEHAALVAAKLADFIVIPFRVGGFDAEALGDSVNIAQLSRKPACFVVNAVPSFGEMGQEAEEGLREGWKDIPVAPVRIGQRVAHVHAAHIGQGAQEYEPRGKAADEVSRLFTYLSQQTGLEKWA